MLYEKPQIEDTWNVRIHLAQDASYESVDIKNAIYPYWVISYIKEGSVEVVDGSIFHAATSGQVMVHAPGLPFSERATGRGRHQWILLEAYNHFGVDLFRLYPVGELLTLADPDEYSALFEQLLAAWNKPVRSFKEMELCGLGLQLVHLLLENWERSGRIPRQYPMEKRDERLDQVYAFIINSLNRKMTRQSLAELVHLNPNYLDEIFQEKFHIKPMQMLRDLRLKYAKRMLENSDFTLSEIAQQCGMNDAPYLSHKFQKHFGLSPGKYREQVQQAKSSYYE